MAPSEVQKPKDESQEQLIGRLFDEITVAAKAKDFERAETLREELLTVAPMALREVIGSAEIIEQEKTSGVDADHLAIWDHLYSTLTEEEKNGLFYSLRKSIIPPKNIILAQGGYNTRLFFIDKGRVAILSPKKEKGRMLAQMGKGNLLGEYSFTSISLCSATAVSVTEVEMYCLDNAATDSWYEKYPGLYERLLDFCVKHGNLEEISRWKALEKKDKPRYPVTGPLKGVLLSKEGKKTKTYFRGELVDISLEGCAFEIKISKKATARALLARNLLLHFSFKVGDELIEFRRVGKIVKVSFYMHNEYCLHIRLEKAIKKELLEKILA
ncbi:cyclic nucleotide-binding domain-containing protein [Desulfopila sp. IMCC35008]|uniref:cyclic nucleotide-binding domain-containing protein n=1 Tax=Desulfopila sp. IMCC35008 TaxID=2653858 RepID=UPI0013D71434|nr:cyclic nucleotide-binding domain-containing protein [Desulfopila sp. IMCC35008]